LNPVSDTVASWLAAAVADARQRGLAPLEPLLTTLAKSTAALRAADAEFRAAADTSQNTPRPDPAAEQ
jgi:hypothetical protein